MCYGEHGMTGECDRGFSERNEVKRLPFGHREKYFASLGGRMNAVRPSREAFCFSRRADERRSAVERSILLPSKGERPPFGRREKHFASLGGGTTAVRPSREAFCFPRRGNDRRSAVERSILLPSKGERTPFGHREKHFASLGGRTNAVGPSREAFCFPQIGDSRLIILTPSRVTAAYTRGGGSTFSSPIRKASRIRRTARSNRSPAITSL